MELTETAESLLQDSKKKRDNRAENGRKVTFGVLDSIYGSEGQEFESLRAHQKRQVERPGAFAFSRNPPPRGFIDWYNPVERRLPDSDSG